MKIKTIVIFSHDGRKRGLEFKTEGLNIITGKSSTGKSELSNIIEFCMGRSTNIISDGITSEKVSWFGVVYQFDGIQVFVAKPVAKPGAQSVSTVMLIEGRKIQIPDYHELSTNTDDDTVIKVLSTHLGIPANRTDVPIDRSRTSFQATIKHAYYYLFQKQNIVSNQDILFYRQNEPFQPQAIKDTLPILLGIESDEKYRIEVLLKQERRNLKLCEKQIQEAEHYQQTISQNGIRMLQEAKAVGMLAEDVSSVSSDDEILHMLTKLRGWAPAELPDTDDGKVRETESIIEKLREQRRYLSDKRYKAEVFSLESNNFFTEAHEQKSRLESINMLPKNEEGEWQWPFSEENLAMASPLAEALLKELEELDNELSAVAGDKPAVDDYIQSLDSEIQKLNEDIKTKTSALSTMIEANETIKQLHFRNYAASKTLGRISMYLDNYVEDNSMRDLIRKEDQIKRRIKNLEDELGSNNTDERIQQVSSIISHYITDYMKKFEVEHSGKHFYLDIKKLEITFFNGTHHTPLNRTGGGENHLAIHLSTMLGFHKFVSEAERPIPNFLIIDQPSQVYFPQEANYRAVDGTEDSTMEAFADHDMTKVRNMFKVLHDFTLNDVEGFQLIVTEHANFSDEWFQDALVEPIWSGPPALVPDDWPTFEEFKAITN